MFKYKKELGQNFLKNPKTIEVVVEALDAVTEDFIIEIGPGNGALTKVLLQKHAKIGYKGIEIDNRVIPALSELIQNSSKQEIINTNILDWLVNENVPEKFKLLGALPFYITSPILLKLLALNQLPNICVLILQEEAANKVLAADPDATFIGNYVQTFFEVEEVIFIDKSDFEPVPAVNAKAIKLKLKNTLPIKPEDSAIYEKFLRRVFLNPRKMLNKTFSQGELDMANIESNLRPQQVTLEKWITLFQKLKSQ